MRTLYPVGLGEEHMAETESSHDNVAAASSPMDTQVADDAGAAGGVETSQVEMGVRYGQWIYFRHLGQLETLFSHLSTPLEAKSSPIFLPSLTMHY